ncbi:MAG: HEAT repeat domain-containing protein [Labilithrix sp.]
MFCRTLFATLLFAALAPRTAAADTLEVGIHDTSISVNGGKTIPIPLPVSGPRKSEQHTIPIGDGKRVIHVKVTSQGQTWEAIVAGGASDPIFAGVTGFTTGEEGERTGQVILVTDRDESSKFVLVGDVREDTRICGQPMTPLSVRALDPKTMALRGASVHRIEKKEREAASALEAVPATARAPLARLLAASGGSGGAPPALTDGKAETAWNEEKSGDGHGEFVSMRAPIETPLHSLLVTTAAKGEAPRTFFVATDAKLFRVTLPEEAGSKPGHTFEVPFPSPVKTSCVSVVLDEAYEREGSPVVSIAEVAARTKFDADGASLDDVVKELGGARADEAAAVLRRGGDAALAAVAAAWPKLDAKARAFAVDVASSAGACNGPAMDLLTHALTDREREVQKRASGRIERCGKNAIGALSDAVRSNDEARRAASAMLLASISSSAAWDPIAEQIGKGKPETRHALRAALAKSSAPREKLVGLFQRPDLTPDMKLDALRALGPRLPEVKPEAQAALAQILAGAPDFRTRYLALEPLAQIGDRARLVSYARTDAEWPVRARAVELLPGERSVESALADPEPRVREAALRARVGTSVYGLRDEWSFVRVAAAESMGVSKENPRALAAALGDPSPKVRAAVVAALGASGARSEAKALRERLDDLKEDVEVRALAARTLGQLCVQDAADRLTKLALLAAHPVDEADERIGNAALDALAMLHPPDLAQRLGPLRANGSRTLLKRAADLAVSAPGTCH